VKTWEFEIGCLIGHFDCFAWTFLSTFLPVSFLFLTAGTELFVIRLDWNKSSSKTCSE